MQCTVLLNGEDKVGGIMAKPEQAGDMPPNWCAYVTVDDVDATAAKIEEHGGKLPHLTLVLTLPWIFPKSDGSSTSPIHWEPALRRLPTRQTATEQPADRRYQIARKPRSMNGRGFLRFRALWVSFGLDAQILD